MATAALSHTAERRANFVADVHGGRSGTLPPGWDNVPNFKSREDLLAARRRAARPDMTFDLDGDGFVSQSDFKVSSVFDVDKDGRLLGEERKNALNWQHSDDPRTKFQTAQTMNPNENNYFDGNNTLVNGEERKTRSRLKAERRQENLTTLQQKYDEWKQNNRRGNDIMSSFDDSLLNVGREEGAGRSLNATWSNITRGRRERSRLEAGLLAQTTHINPVRASMDPTLDYVAQPDFKSRNALMQHRRDDLVDANDKTLHSTEVYFRTAQQRLKEREDSLHLMRQLAPPGESRAALLESRRRQIVSELAATFDGRSSHMNHEKAERNPDIDDSSRPAFWTLQEGYNPEPAENSSKHLKESRKFWKKEEIDLEERSGGDTFKTVSHMIHDGQGFEPPPIQLQQFAVGQQPRRAKPPASSAIRSKLKFIDPISSPRSNPIEERMATAPLYSSFSQDKIYNPKPLPKPSVFDAEGRKIGKRKQKKEAIDFAPPQPLMNVLSTMRPYTVCSLIETQTKVRSGGFQLALARE